MNIDEDIQTAELFAGLSPASVHRLATIARVTSLRAGEYLFLLGDSAQYVSLVRSGLIELCFPISMGGVVKDIAVETVGRGSTIGWSAMVKPYRFTLSARAAETSEVVAFARQDLHTLFLTDAAAQRTVVDGISELMANRLATFQALWARELMRTLSAGSQGGPA